MWHKTGSGCKHPRLSGNLLALGMIVGCIVSSLVGLGGLVQEARAEATPVVKNTNQSERRQFIAARNALEAKNSAIYEKNASELSNYVLAPYLDFFSLRQRISSVTAAEINAFIERYPDDFLIGHLWAAWTNELMRRRDWSEFLKTPHRLSSVEQRCAQAQALYATGQAGQADSLGLNLWNVGRSQPAGCDPVFVKLSERGKITPAHVRERIALAVEKGENDLARYLARQLKEPDDQSFLEDYLEAQQKPTDLLGRLLKRKLKKHDAQLISHAIYRIGSTDPEKAMEFLEQAKEKKKLNSSQIITLKNHIVLYAALRFHPLTTEWGRSIPVFERSKSVREWTARYYLRQQDWAGVLRAISVMTVEEQQTEVWRYWKARSEQELGNNDQATEIFEALSNRRSYYGFLSASALGKPLQVNEQKTPPALKAESAAFKRVIELREVGMEHWARLEWQFLQSKLPLEERQRMAWLAHEAGWHDLVFMTAIANKHEDNLELRFPLPRREELDAALLIRPLDPAWVYALMRRESSFRPAIRSKQGATGLMQIMPETGRQLARDLKITDYQFSDLVIPEKNIALGTFYLEQLRERFGGSVVLSTAAYNAGPRNVLRWLPQDASMPVDVWIDTVTYRETREYVQAVLAYAVVYQWRLQGKTGALFYAGDEVVTPLAVAPVVQAKK